MYGSREIGGAFTGRLKSLELALFSGVASPNQKSRHHDMKTGQGTLSSGGVHLCKRSIFQIYTRVYISYIYVYV